MTVIGFRVHVDGIMRVFHDTKAVAHQMARNLKSKHKKSKIEIIDEASGTSAEMLEDGRTS